MAAQTNAETWGSRRWLGPLTNRRVGTKIMIAVLLVTLFSVFDGLYALNSLGTTNNQVKAVYAHSTELDTIGDLRSAVNRTWLAADDYLLATDTTGRAAATTALTAARNDVATTAATYKGYQLGPDATTNVTTFDTTWAQYLSLLQDQLMPLAARGDTAGVNRLRASDQAPLLATLRTALGALSTITLTAAVTQEQTAETRSYWTFYNGWWCFVDFRSR